MPFISVKHASSTDMPLETTSSKWEGHAFHLCETDLETTSSKWEGHAFHLCETDLEAKRSATAKVVSR